jgi:Spy/CpxP family protein refolding chaperone
VANLYVERASIPHHVSHQIDERGEVDLSEMSQQVSRGEVTREVQASLVMTPEHAMQFGQWLQENAQQAMEQRRQTYG